MEYLPILLPVPLRTLHVQHKTLRKSFCPPDVNYTVASKQIFTVFFCQQCFYRSTTTENSKLLPK